MRVSMHFGLLILASFFATSCAVDENAAPAGNSAVLGRWTASQNISIPEEGISATVLYEIDVKENSKSDFRLFWNGNFAKGFSGTWILRDDTLGLYAEKCFKGESAGSRIENDCNEDFRDKYIPMLWDGVSIKFGTDSNEVVFQKI